MSSDGLFFKNWLYTQFLKRKKKKKKKNLFEEEKLLRRRFRENPDQGRGE